MGSAHDVRCGISVHEGAEEKMKAKEEWRPVVGYEGLYEVSNLGCVRSLDRYVDYKGIVRFRKGKILKQSLTTTGYKKVTLCDKNHKRKHAKVHRLVAMAFIPKPKNKNLINHKDGNPLNNRMENLEWCTYSENITHAYQNGLREWSLKGKEDEIIKEYLTNEKATCHSIAKKFNCGDGRSIKRLLIERGIKLRTHQESVGKVPYRILMQEFKKGTRNIDISRKYNISLTTVKKYKKKFKKEIA